MYPSNRDMARRAYLGFLTRKWKIKISSDQSLYYKDIEHPTTWQYSKYTNKIFRDWWVTYAADKDKEM